MMCACRIGHENYICLRCTTMKQWHKDIKESARDVTRSWGPGDSERAWRDEYRRGHVALGLMLDLYVG